MPRSPLQLSQKKAKSNGFLNAHGCVELNLSQEKISNSVSYFVGPLLTGTTSKMGRRYWGL